MDSEEDSDKGREGRLPILIISEGMPISIYEFAIFKLERGIGRRREEPNYSHAQNQIVDDDLGCVESFRFLENLHRLRVNPFSSPLALIDTVNN